MGVPLSTDGVDQRLVDAVLGVGVTLGVAATIAVDLDETGRADPGAYLFAGVFGALVLARRQAPRAVLVATVLGVFLYYALGYAPIGIALPAVVALASAAEAGHTRWAVGAGTVLVSAAAVALVEEGRPLDYLVSYEMLTNVALVATAVTLGASIRARREARRHQEQLHRVVLAEQAREAEQRLREERLSIARDLHDVVGHALSVIALHGNVAAEAIGRDEDVARRAIGQIGRTTSATMRELRATVKVLRSPGGRPELATLGLAGVPDLVSAARETGVDVVAELDVPGGVLDGAVDAAAYRIVQESLTNALRHSGASRVTVRAGLDGGRLELTVCDDGCGPGDALRPGAGMAGIEERAVTLGGGVSFGRSDDGGFAVRARLPVRVGT
ncbi:sensor histidine kinase [Georgenia sp. 311]|uniref:sensor histidine kinase n=1 Tax=Georgenia sp. 311 TaxID=2585134 RepID=UPI0011126864|nr:sensor histidine kinase [Georgenia sp. 311]TNC18318.1 sensor histidine kinase [Georgenia sp. 311]